jgi:outer membrane protein
MVMKRSLIPAAILSLAMSGYAQQPLAANPSAAGPQKIAIMSLQGALVGTKDGQKANQELTAKYEPKKKEFDTRQNEIAQEEDQLRKSGNVMSEDKRNETARDIDEKKRRLQRDMQDAEQDLQAEQQKVLQGLGQRLMAVINKYAKDNGFTMVLDDSNPSNPILYASSSVDITQDIIDLYNKTSVNGGPATTPSVPSAATPGTPAVPGTRGPNAGR